MLRSGLRELSVLGRPSRDLRGSERPLSISREGTGTMGREALSASRPVEVVRDFFAVLQEDGK